MTLRRQNLQLGNDSPVLVEQLLRLVAAHPLVREFQAAGVGGDIRDRDLVRTPVALEVVLAQLPRGGPTFGAAQYDHGPARPESLSGTPRLLLDLADLQDTLFQGGGHSLVHSARVTAFDKVRCVPVADEQGLQFLVADAGEDGEVIDLVAVKVQYRQHRAVGDWVEKLVAVPARGERTCL